MEGRNKIKKTITNDISEYVKQIPQVVIDLTA